MWRGGSWNVSTRKAEINKRWPLVTGTKSERPRGKERRKYIRDSLRSERAPLHVTRTVPISL